MVCCDAVVCVVAERRDRGREEEEDRLVSFICVAVAPAIILDQGRDSSALNQSSQARLPNARNKMNDLFTRFDVNLFPRTKPGFILNELHFSLRDFSLFSGMRPRLSRLSLPHRFRRIDVRPRDSAATHDAAIKPEPPPAEHLFKVAPALESPVQPAEQTKIKPTTPLCVRHDGGGW